MSGAEHLQRAPDRAEERVVSLRAATPPFQSVAFVAGTPDLDAVVEPEFFHDLNLDQLVAAILEGRDEYELAPFFHRPLASLDEVEYRHEVFRDLESEAVRAGLTRFGEEMHRVRAFLTLAAGQHYRHAQQRWFLDSADLYCAAISELTTTLRAEAPRSVALRGFLDHLIAYTATASFAKLRSDAGAVLAGLDGVRYTVRINGARVTVAAFEDEPNYSTEIEELFSRFRQGAVDSYLIRIPDPGSMDHVEAQIVGLVANLFPREFEALSQFCRDHQGFLDGTVNAFDREVQFYLATMEHLDRLAGRGLSVCLPDVSDDSKDVEVHGGFDLALASKLSDLTIRTNGFRLRENERIMVVTGPNQGGKTTFARMFGQLHYLASLGVPVPAERARLFLADRIFTHFEREEVVGSLRGKLDDELIRVRDILAEATPASVVVMNEMFASAALADALALGLDVLSQLIERECIGVCVTFIDELSRLGESTVSMVAQVSPDDPAVRTFEILECPTDGRAYAWALAKKYGLGYEQLRERLQT